MAEGKDLWIAVDPGKTCGWSLWKGKKVLKTGQSNSLTLFRLIEETDVKFVVYERFILRASAAKAMIGNEFGTVQTIGVLKYICKQKGIPCIGQTPAQRTFFTNDRLKEMGVYEKGKPHAMDSVRHGLYYLAFTKKAISVDGN